MYDILAESSLFIFLKSTSTFPGSKSLQNISTFVVIQQQSGSLLW